MKPLTIYLVTRAHGLHTHLLTREDYSSLTKAKSLNAMTENLLRGDYGPEISKMPSGAASASDLNQVFYSILVSRVYYLSKIAPNKAREFMVTYADRYQVENVKRILRSKRTGGQITPGKLIPIPREYALINFQAMMEAPTQQDVLELLKATRYAKVAEEFPIYQKYEVQALLEALLDKIYFDQLWASIDKIPDHKKAEEVIGTEIDLKNIGMMIDLKSRNVNPSVILSASFRSFRLKEEDKSQIAASRIDLIPDVVAKTPYQGLAPSLKSLMEEKRIEQLEHVILREVYTKVKTVTRRSPNSFIYVIGFLAEAEMETRNLITISTGKELGVEEEKLMPLLYL
ncbi:MAG: V-type ATPase subunit [Nitrososphaeria archaeon]